MGRHVGSIILKKINALRLNLKASTDGCFFKRKGKVEGLKMEK